LREAPNKGTIPKIRPLEAKDAGDLLVVFGREGVAGVVEDAD
jgi:hypothetical protein